jgi:SAM-dependent methyltransferase
LPHTRKCQRGLLIGDGDGRFSAALLENNPTIRIESLDISAGMLKRARARAGCHRGRIEFIHTDALTYAYPENTYDFIGLHFCLDCLTQNEIASLLPRLEKSLRSGGIVAHSDFRANHRWQRILVSALYLLFRAGAGLKANKLPDVSWSEPFETLAETEALGGLVFSKVSTKR